MWRSTLSRVAGDTSGRPLSTRETVATESPARAAISGIATREHCAPTRAVVTLFFAEIVRVAILPAHLFLYARVGSSLAVSASGFSTTISVGTGHVKAATRSTGPI